MKIIIINISVCIVYILALKSVCIAQQTNRDTLLVALGKYVFINSDSIILEGRINDKPTYYKYIDTLFKYKDNIYIGRNYKISRESNHYYITNFNISHNSKSCKQLMKIANDSEYSKYILEKKYGYYNIQLIKIKNEKFAKETYENQSIINHKFDSISHIIPSIEYEKLVEIMSEFKN